MSLQVQYVKRTNTSDYWIRKVVSNYFIWKNTISYMPQRGRIHISSDGNPVVGSIVISWSSPAPHNYRYHHAWKFGQILIVYRHLPFCRGVETHQLENHSMGYGPNFWVLYRSWSFIEIRILKNQNSCIVLETLQIWQRPSSVANWARSGLLVRLHAFGRFLFDCINWSTRLVA